MIVGRKIIGLVLLGAATASASVGVGPLAQPGRLNQAVKLFTSSLSMGATTSPTLPTGWAPIVAVNNSNPKAIPWKCETIKVMVNAKLAPKGAVKDLKTALSQLSAATGVTWQFAGFTNEMPTLNRDPQKPVLVAWVRGGAKDVNGNTLINKTESGRSGPVYSSDATHWSSGVAVFNIDEDSRYTPGFGTGRTRGTLLLHELGHVAGLGHVQDETNVMTEYSAVRVGPSVFSADDLQGLHAVFAGCRER